MNPRTLILAVALGLLLAVAIVFGGCAATRSSACDTLATNGEVAQKQAPSQSTAKWDALTGAAIADSDGDAVQSNQRVAVDVQAPNQSTGPNLSISSLTGGAEAAAKILSTTSPGEAAVVARIEANEKNLEAIDARLATDAALLPEERVALTERASSYRAALDPLLARLDVYAKAKFDAAKSFVPDLSGLKTIVYQITTNTVAGSALPNISDAQGAAIAAVAEAAVTTSQTEGGE